MCPSLISSTIVFDPAVDMTASGIAMRPVDDAALGIPLILTVELDVIASLQRSNATRQVDIVRDEQRLA